jgi:hypothetical protein
MARQDGIIKLKGRIGDMSFIKTEDGYLARRAGGIDGKRVLNDPQFARTRENGAEFGRAGTAAKLIRTALRSLIMKAADSRMTSRLTKEMVRVIKADTTSDRGKRNVLDGEVELLKGFEFNNNGTLSQTFFAPFTATIDRASGNLTIDIPAFVPAVSIASPQGATHCKLNASAIEADFEANVYAVSASESADIEVTAKQQAAIQLANPLPANSTRPLLLAFGVEFYQLVNGNKYPLNNGSFNALALVAVNGGV